MTLRQRKVAPLVIAGATALLVVVAGAAYALFNPFAPSTVVAAPSSATTTSTPPTAALSARLLIPTLHIDAPIQNVGRAANGLMASPSNFTSVAWFREGTIPGHVGSAVFAGHLDNALGLNGVFKHLGEMHVGDDVEVDTVEGDILHFKVTDIEQYPYQGVPADVFTREDGAYLNLITCAGTWLPASHTYDHRVVVYTKLVSS